MKLSELKIADKVSNIFKKISPIEVAGGLVVSDSVLRYVRYAENGSIAAKASLRLPPGAVVGGKVKDANTIAAALRQLRDIIGMAPAKRAEVVLSIDSGAVYSQLFSLPLLDERALSGAADLNIQMISPIDINKSYYGYQIVGRPDTVSGGGYELLGAFISAPVVDEWISAIKSAGFLPIAVEFQALSVTRAVTELAGTSKGEIALVLDVASEGMDLLILKNGNLYFDYFYPWKLIQGDDKTISMEKFRQILVAETGKVMNFALSKFGGEIKSILINADGIGEDMISVIKKAYSSMPVSKLSLSGKISAVWVPAMGAAKRGTLLRSEDNLISLSPLSVIEEYIEGQVISMIKVWRNVFVITLAFFLFIFSLSDIFLRQTRINASQQSLRGLSAEETKELGLLRGQADEFNSLVSLVGEAKRRENKVHPFISKLTNLGGSVQLTRLSVQDIGQPIVLNGNAPSADAVVQFQKRLIEQPSIIDLQFPLSSLVSAPNGRTAFVMSFRIKSLDF